MMVDIITAISTNLFRTFLIKRFMSIFYDTDSENKKTSTLFYTLFYLVTTTVYLVFHYPPINIIINIAMIYLISLSYFSDYRKKILVTFLIYSINMICDILSVFLFSNYVIGQPYNVISAYITVFLIFICEFILERCIEINGKEKQFPPYWSFILIIPIISILMLSYLLMENLNKRILFIIESSGMLCINMLIFFLYNVLVDAYTKLEESLMYEKQVRQYSNQLDIMMQTENKIRALQHDMKHHLIELLSLARESNNNLNIEEYILNMKEFISNHREYTHSGNKDVDSVLNYMIQQAEQKLKKVEYKISIPEELDMRSFDLNMILGNLLENAIEAAVNSTEKELSITIDYKKGILFLEVWNSYNGKIIKRNGHYMTTKENIASHGIGLENVKKVVENHNGTMDVLYDKNTFDIKIMLYTFKLRHKIYEFRNLQV